jgi:hypothetical protein
LSSVDTAVGGHSRLWSVRSTRTPAKQRRRVRVLRQSRENCLYTRGFPHRVGGLPTVPTDPPPAKTRIPSTPRPQAIHSASTPLSTLIPQVAHMLCTGGADHSEEGFGPRPAPPDPGYKSPHTWGQPWGQPGPSVDESGDARNHPRTARSTHRSATRVLHTPASRPTCANELNPHNPQRLLLLLPLDLLRERTKQKQAKDEVGDSCEIESSCRQSQGEAEVTAAPATA